MAQVRWNWNNLRKGQIVTFKYKGKDRTVLVLAPSLPLQKTDGSIVDMLHGIQLEVSGNKQLTLGQIIKVLNKSGKLGRLVVENNIQYYAIDINDPQIAYSKIKDDIKGHGVYKTYKVNVAKRAIVYLEDFSFPTTVIKKVGV